MFYERREAGEGWGWENGVCSESKDEVVKKRKVRVRNERKLQENRKNDKALLFLNLFQVGIYPIFKGPSFTQNILSCSAVHCKLVCLALQHISSFF